MLPKRKHSAHLPIAFSFWMVLVSWLFFPARSHAGLVVFDDVTTPGAAIFCKVQTRGRIFPQGGQRVWVQAGREDERAILTGGDGFGYVKMQFARTGLETLTARTQNDRNQARVLVIDPETPVLVIEIAAAFRPALLAEKGLDTCRRVLRELSERYPVVYLGGTIGAPVIRDWLMNHGFPPGPVLAGQGRKVLRTLQHRGVCVGALLASVKLAETAEDLVEHRFCFEQTAAGTHIDGWEDFLKQLTSGAHPFTCRPVPGDKGRTR